MKFIAVAVLFFFQAIFILLAVWQAIGLLPALSWFGSPGVTTGMWFAAGIKLGTLIVSMLLWWILGRLRIRIRDREQIKRA